MDQLASVPDDERHRAGPDLVRLERDRELAEAEVEAVVPGEGPASPVLEG